MAVDGWSDPTGGGARRRWRLVGVLVLLAAVLAAIAGAGAALGVAWVREGGLVVADGARRTGPLVVSGGEVLLAPGSRTDGPILLLGGSVTIDGLVDGVVLAPAGALTLGPWAVVRGQVRAAGGVVRHPAAVVQGRLVTGVGPQGVLGGGWWRVLLQAAATAACAAAWARLAPKRLRSMGVGATRHAAVAAAVGAVVLAVAGAALVALALTVVLLPVAFALLAVGLVALGTGWAALGAAIADRLARGVLRDWADRPVLLAAIGGFDVALAAGLVERVPVVGPMVVVGLSALALGAVAVTGGGGRGWLDEGAA